MTLHTALCFCGSGRQFETCCEPILNDHSMARTPLALMRSRYTAYVLANEEFLLRTWDISTRPSTLDLANHPVKWLRLTIHSPLDEHNSRNNAGEVDFSAHYLADDFLCELREKSRFIRHESMWYYLDGKPVVTRTAVGRNSPCPCGSGKKFKRCCLP